MRGKVIPVRGTMTAQRPGTGLPTDTIGGRAHVFHYPALGFDYLTQLPRREGESEGGELLFGGGTMQAGGFVLSEIGVADDSGYHLGIASHIQGALPEYFGHKNWGAESVDVPREVEEENSLWGQGRIKASWTGILGISADMQPWVGRVPSVISGRPLLTKAFDIAVARSLAPAGEWVSTGYSGEGMVHAWLCAHALALMVLGLENEEGVHTWFPDEYRLTEKRWKKATIEQLMAKF
jgi:glycine/D-amino acid oxidase-like deaminating enzyme